MINKGVRHVAAAAAADAASGQLVRCIFMRHRARERKRAFLPSYIYIRISAVVEEDISRPRYARTRVHTDRVLQEIERERERCGRLILPRGFFFAFEKRERE